MSDLAAQPGHWHSGLSDWGAVFHLVRKYAGVSQVRIAAAVDMTPSRIGEVIRGQREITSLDVIERISDRLHIPGTMLGLAPRPWETSGGGRGTNEATALGDIGAILGDTDLDMSADSTVRIAAAWLAVEPPQVVELHAGRQVGSALVHRIEARTRHLRRMDDFVGGRDSLPVVLREVDTTAALIRQAAAADEVRAALLAALAELCQLAGWVLDDAGEPDRAAQYYLSGARAAEAAGERGIAANLLSTLSYSMANNGQEPDAVLLARSAALAGAPHVSPLGRALLWDRVAWAHARGGDERECRRALDAADQAFGRSPGDEVPVNSARVDDRVTVLRRALCRYADSPAVRDVEERSHALLRSA
jgi:transcriptional regulator with XRE-family HTH domain